MRLPPFHLHRPRSLDDALRLLAQLGEEAAVYMGGTELLLVMKMGYAAPEHLIDCKAVEELHELDLRDRSEWSIGAGVTHRRLEFDVDVLSRLPQLARLEGQIANVRVRNAGTLGGNLCFAEPHSDPPGLLVALGAEVELASATGRRRVRLEDFIAGPFTTGIATGELMLRVIMPPVPGDSIVRYQRLAFKERPVITMSYVRIGADDHRVVVGAVGARPTRLRSVEALLRDGRDEPRQLINAAMAEVEPFDDLEGSAEYKRHLVGVLTRRLLLPSLPSR